MKIHQEVFVLFRLFIHESFDDTVKYACERNCHLDICESASQKYYINN